MERNAEINLDHEFKKYLQILRPYLGQLINQNEIDLCNAWIKKLSKCEENEKALRNRYVFVLCYQLAKGVLDEPFLMSPPLDDLPPLHDVSSNDSSFTEIEYLVIDSENFNSNVNSNKETTSQIFTDDSGINIDKNKETICKDANCGLRNIFSKDNLNRTKCDLTLHNYNLPYTFDDFTKCNECEENYQLRANNLIMKLREIKNQNVLLHNELMILRQESNRIINDSLENIILKVDQTTSTSNCMENKLTYGSLKCKLQEIQNSRNNLIETVGSLQDNLDYFNEIKKHETEEIEAKHKLEIIKLKTITREEVKIDYEKKLDDLKKQYESLILEMQNGTKEEIERFCKSKEQMIAEKDKLIQLKEVEISTLKHQLEELKEHQFSVLNKFLDGSNENRSDSARTYELEKRLYKMERTKNKCAKAYEAKVASLQREKHLAECSLQLQLVKQRAKVLNEVTEENQVELATELNKLENKYKEIIANVQATAVQRRIQDQIALESLVQAVCSGIPKENPCVNSTNGHGNQFSGYSVNKNQRKDRHRSCDREIETLCNSNRVDNVVVENKSFGEDSVGTGYCLDSVKLQELFERVHIPQRDVGDIPK